MKTYRLIPAALIALSASLPAAAEEAETPPPVLQSGAGPQTAGRLPELSDLPIMQAQGKRLAAIMEKIQQTNDPAERKRLLAEAVCPQ